MKKNNSTIFIICISIMIGSFFAIMYKENKTHNKIMDKKQKAYDYELRMNNYLHGYNDALEGLEMDSNYIAPNPFLK